MDQYKEFWYDWMGFNQWLFIAINDIRLAGYDSLMYGISMLARHKYFTFYLGALLAYVILRVCKKLVMKNQGITNYLKIWLGVFLVLTAGYALNGFVINTLKDSFAYPRPYIALADSHQVNQLEFFEDSAKDHQSFPSGHVAFATFLVVALWPVLSEIGAWVGVGFIAAVMWSRVSLGVHFPADAVGALLISSTLIFLLRSVVYWILHRFFKIKC